MSKMKTDKPRYKQYWVNDTGQVRYCEAYKKPLMEGYCTHVIEYTAVEQLEQMVKELEQQNQLVMQVYGIDDSKNVVEIVENLIDERQLQDEKIAAQEQEIERLKADNDLCNRQYEAANMEVKDYCDEMFEQKKVIQSLQEKLADYEKTMAGARDYLLSCGYDKIENCEPEFQMLKSFAKVLEKWKAKI